MNWLQMLRTRHWRIYVAAVLAFWCMIGFGVHAAVDTARGAGICRVADPEQRCWTAKHAAWEFRHGYYTRSHGIPARKVYAHPRQARLVWVHKIDRWLNRHPHKAAVLRQSTGRHMTGGGIGAGCPADVSGLACELYQKIAFESTCVSQAPYPTAAPSVCHMFDHPYLDTVILKRAGTVFFCGGSVVLAAGTKGGSSLFMAGWGASACGWGLW